MKVVVDTHLITWAPGAIPRGVVKGLEDVEIRGYVKTIQNATLLRIQSKYREESKGKRGDLLSLKLLWETTSERWYEKLSKN